MAGVTPMEGRAWYGIRRKGSDVYEDFEGDERVLNNLTGHRTSETRRQIYQEREREAVRARAAITRRRVRQEVFGVVPLIGESEKSAAPVIAQDVAQRRPAHTGCP